MYTIETYRNIESEIKTSSIRIRGLKDQLRIIGMDLKGPGEIGCQQYDSFDMPKGSKRDNSYIESVIERARLEAMLEKQELILKSLLEQKEEINVQLHSLEGMEYKVFKLRYIDNLTVSVVAERLGTSSRTVDRIIARIKRKKKE